MYALGNWIYLGIIYSEGFNLEGSIIQKFLEVYKF